MAPTVLYILCVLGAAGLYLLINPRRRGFVAVGTLLGLAALAGLIVEAAKHVSGSGELDGHAPGAFYTLFTVFAVASAVRMITHTRPVYSALYFVLVVLCTAAMFLLLEAEFMAFALIIVYAGAILITYMFVLMLAQQAASPDDVTGQPAYDLFAREPAAATIVGFIILAMLGNMIFMGIGDAQLPPRITPIEATAEAYEELNEMPRLIESLASATVGGPVTATGPVYVEDDRVLVEVMNDAGETQIVDLAANPDSMPHNIQRVGLALVAKFPASLELAGIILLMAMFGAVVLARKQIELGEADVREAAGLPRLSEHDEPGGAGA